MEKKIGTKFIYIDKDKRKHQLLVVQDIHIDCSKCFFGDGVSTTDHPCKTHSSIVGQCTAPSRSDHEYTNFILLRSQKVKL